LRRQLDSAWAEIKELRRTVAHQARLLQNLASETHPAAPSVNAVYWLFSDSRRHERSWRLHWQRLQPSLRGLGTVPAPEVTPIAWNRHVSARRHEEQRGGGTPSDITLNIELARLKAMLDWAVENRMIDFNPLRAAKRIKTRDQRETRLTPDDIDRILIEAESLRDQRLAEEDDDGCRSKMLQASALCWFDSMMRVSEARHIRRSLIQPNGDYRIPRDHTKTDAGERTVTLTARTLEAIKAIPVHPKSDYVFVNQHTGKLLSYHTIRRWFRWACERGRLDAKAAPRDRRIVIHHVRHAGATAADAAGVRPGALSTVLGHTDSRATARYIHREGVESAHHVAELMERRPPRRTRK
jgi:site-specific recombinase XerD